MAINLNPELVAFDHRAVKGALVRIASRHGNEPSGGSTTLSGDIVEFQYNPETITRTRTGKWEPRNQRRRPAEVASPQQIRGERGGQGSAALMAESETISLKIAFDATEAILAGRQFEDDGPTAASQGVLPQLAFLELLSLGKEGEQSRRRNRSNRESARPIRPDELLLVLGRERLFPVVMTNLTITEQKFNPALVPIRAEVDIKMNVLEPVESAYSNWIRSAFTRLFDARRVAADRAAQPGTALDAIKQALKSPQSD